MDALKAKFAKTNSTTFTLRDDDYREYEVEFNDQLRCLTITPSDGKFNANVDTLKFLLFALDKCKNPQDFAEKLKKLVP